jgi:hypothetical protein
MSATQNRKTSIARSKTVIKMLEEVNQLGVAVFNKLIKPRARILA